MNPDKDLTGLSPDEHKRIRTTRLSQLTTWQIIPNWIWVVIVIIGCILLLKENSAWWLKLIGLLLISYSSLQIGSRAWRIDDFMEGYEHGFSDGIDRSSTNIEKKNNNERN